MRDHKFSRRSVLRAGAALAATGSSLAYVATKQPALATSGDWSASDLETSNTDTVEEVVFGRDGEVILEFSNLDDDMVYDVEWSVDGRLTAEGVNGSDSTNFEQLAVKNGDANIDTSVQGSSGSKSFEFLIDGFEDAAHDKFRQDENNNDDYVDIIEQHNHIEVEDFHTDDPPEETTVELQLNIELRDEDGHYAVENTATDTFTVTISENNTTLESDGDSGTGLTES